MSVIAVVVLIFSLLGAVDFLLGNKLGLGREFEKGFSIFVPMVMSMLGVLVLAPAIGVWLTPVFNGFYEVFGIDPSILPASLLANDMGGTVLALQVARDSTVGAFSAFVVASMLGSVISFGIPFALGVVKKHQHKELFFGLLCGIVTIPVGCFVAGLVCGVGVGALLLTLLPVIILSVLLCVLLIFFTNACIKAFFVFGNGIRAVSIVGLVLGIFTFLTKIEVYEHFDSFENAAMVCVNACVTLSGALPLMYVLVKLLNKPLGRVGRRIGIDALATVSLLTILATSSPVFGVMEKMNKKGVVLNAAFAVSASYTFGSHLAYTMAVDGTYVLPMIVGKVISGVCAVLLALVLYKDRSEDQVPLAAD